MSNIFWLILLFPCLLWIPNFFVEETKLGSLESFVARLGERQQRGCVSVEGRQGFWVKRWCCRCGESVCIVGSLRASVYVCVCVYSLWVIWTLHEYIYTCWCGMLHAWGEGDATCWILMVMVCSKDLGVLFLLHMRFGSSSVHMYRRSTCDGVRFYLHRQ